MTQNITTMEGFLQEHSSTDQAYQIVNFISGHLDRIVENKKPSRPDKKRYYKSLLITKGNILGALLN